MFLKISASFSFVRCLLILCHHLEGNLAWITLSKQGLIINKTRLSLQSSAHIEGDLLIKGVLRASDYTWVTGQDSKNQEACSSNNIGALRWRNSTDDFFEACDGISMLWRQVQFCDKDCGFPVVPSPSVRAAEVGGPTNCQAQVCENNCSFDSINEKQLFILNLIGISAASVQQQCSLILDSNSTAFIEENSTDTCANITVGRYYASLQQPIPGYFSYPDEIICFTSSSTTCRSENCTDRVVQDLGWTNQEGISGARWILLKDPDLPIYKFARENGLYYYQGMLYPMSITLHDLITYEEPGVVIWPTASLAKLPVELWRQNYQANLGSVDVPFRGTNFLFQQRIPSVFDQGTPLRSDAVLSDTITCAAFDFAAPAFDYLRVFYNVSGWERLLPLTAGFDDNPPDAVTREPEVLHECVAGFQRVIPPPFWLLAGRNAAANTSWAGSVASGSSVVCFNGTCTGMNCSVTLLAPLGYAVQALVGLDLDAQLAHRGDRFTLIERTADGREIVLLDRLGVDDNATIVEAVNVTGNGTNGTGDVAPGCGSGGGPCISALPTSVLIRPTQFGSSLVARFVSTSRSEGRGFNLTYGYMSRSSLLRQRANATLLQLALAILEAQGADPRGFGWERASDEMLTPAPPGTSRLGNFTDAEGCFLCFYYNGSCLGATACNPVGCAASAGLRSSVEGGPIAAPWTSDAPGPAQVGATSALSERFVARVSALEVPAVAAYMGYRPAHYLRTMHVSAFPPGTVKAPYAAVLGKRPYWGPYGDKDPSLASSHPRRASVGWGLQPVVFGSGDQTQVKELRENVYGSDGEFPGEADAGAAQPEWQVLVPEGSVGYVSARRWQYDLDSDLLPSFSFVDADRRIVAANELAMFIPCGLPINNTCGVSCPVLGTALNLLQCGAAAPKTSCNEPVVDLCNNECGLLGTLMCDASAADAGALRIGSVGETSSTITFQLTSQHDENEDSSSLYLSMQNPSERCNTSVSMFDPWTNNCFYTDHGTKTPYQLTQVQLRLLVSREEMDIPVPAECVYSSVNDPKNPSCKFNDPSEITVASESKYQWKRNGQTVNATTPWWDVVSDKRASWTELRAIVSSSRNSLILEVIYVEDMSKCRDRCLATLVPNILACRAHCLVTLAASLMLAYGVDASNLQPCVLIQKPGNTPYKSGLWPSGRVTYPPTGSWPVLDRLCTIAACNDFFPSCYVSLNNILKMVAMFQARRRTMMLQINNRPGFSLAKIRRLSRGRTGIDIANPSNIPANKPQARIENTLRISFLHQMFEKDLLIGNGPSSRIFIDGVIDQECPFHFDPTIAGNHTVRWCYRNVSSSGVTDMSSNASSNMSTNASLGRKNRTITIPDISGRLLTTNTLHDLTSLPGLRKPKALTAAGTSYPRYGIWPLPRFAKIPDPFLEGRYLMEETYNIRPFQGLETRYCGFREDGTVIVCERLKQEYDTLEELSNRGEESFVYTGDKLVSSRILNSTSILNATKSNFTAIWEKARTSISFFEPSQHQKLTMPDASALLISSGNLENVTRTGVLISPIVAQSSDNTVTRLKFGVGWESVKITEANNSLFYIYTEGPFNFCRSGNLLPRIVTSNSLLLPNFEYCSQGDAILFDMGQEWDIDLPLDRPDKCLSMYITYKADRNSSTLPDINSTLTFTNLDGITHEFSVKSRHRVCQNDMVGLESVSDDCASSYIKVSFSDPDSPSVIVSQSNYRYTVCALSPLKNFSSVIAGSWYITRQKSAVLASGIYSLENATNTINSMLMEELKTSLVRLRFSIRDPGEGLCGERPVGSTYNFSFFHCSSASRYIELHGEILGTSECNITSGCDAEEDPASCPVVCQNVSDPRNYIQVLNSSTILETFAIEKPYLAYTFATLSYDPAGVIGKVHPVAPGSGYSGSGYGRMSGFGLGGGSTWTRYIPPDPMIPNVSYTIWCHDGLGFLCLANCSCENAVITFSKVLGSTKTKDGNNPTNNSLLIPRTRNGLLISTANLEDIFMNSSSVSSLHIDAIRVHQTAIGAIIGQRLEFQNSSVTSLENGTTPESGLWLTDNAITFHSFHYMTTWVAIYSPDGQCPAQIFRAIDNDDKEAIWNVLVNKSFCANRTFSSLQDTMSQNASKYACFAYCAGVDSSKEQESILARQKLTEITNDGSNAVDTLLEDPTSYCISVTCNGTTSTAQNLTIDFYLYKPASLSSSDPYLAALSSRRLCTVVCTNRMRCSSKVKDTLVHRPPPYDFSILATIQGWDTCIRMIELESKFSPSVRGIALNARASFELFQANFASVRDRFTLAMFALQQRCSCVELDGFSSSISNGLKDVLEHTCQTDKNPVCVSEGLFQRFPNGLPWQTHLQFTENESDEHAYSLRFLVVPFVSAIVLTTQNLDAITVESGAMTSFNVQKDSHFLAPIKVGVIRESQRAKVESQGSRKPILTGLDSTESFGPYNECSGCVTAGTCQTVCVNAVNQLILNHDSINFLSDVSLTGLGNASTLSATGGPKSIYQIRFPTWDQDLCNQQRCSSCNPRNEENSALFAGTVITSGNLNDIDDLNPNLLRVSGNYAGSPALLSGLVEIGSKFSCSSGNVTGYGRRGWSVFSGVGCAEQDEVGGRIIQDSVLNCKRACESDDRCGVLIVSKIGKNGLDRSSGQTCRLIPMLAAQCTVVSHYNQDLFLNFREAPYPWTRREGSNQFFNSICANANLSFVPGTSISIGGYLSTGITWRPQKPSSWKYFPSSMCDTFDPLTPSRGKYISRIQSFQSIDKCKEECMARAGCGMVSVDKLAKICYLLPTLSNRTILVNVSDSCGGRDSVFLNVSTDAAAKPCILQGMCSVTENSASDLYVFVQNQSVTLQFRPPSKSQTISFPDATGVVVTTGNLYDITSLEGLQGSNVINYTDVNYSSFSLNQSYFWSRYNDANIHLRTFKSPISSGSQNYLKFSGIRLVNYRSGRAGGNIILRECDFSPPQTSIWKVDNPSFSRSGLPDRDCLAIPGCVLFTNVLDSNLLRDAQNAIVQERKSRPGLSAQPTSFRTLYSGTGDGFDSFSYILDFSRPGSRISNTTCLRNCAGGIPCDRAIGYLPCERGTLGCHINCPGYMYPRPGVDTQAACAGQSAGNYVAGSPCGCPGGRYYQNSDGNTYGSSVCVIPNTRNSDHGRFCIVGSNSIPKGWIAAESCCRNKSDVINCGVCTEFPPFPPDGSNNRITFPDTSGTVITTGNMDDLTVLTLQLDNLVISGSLDLGIISSTTTPTFGPQGFRFDPDTGTNGIWRTAINLDPFTTKVLGGLPLVAGIGSPGNQYIDPATQETFSGSGQFYPLTRLINSPVTDLTGSSRNDVVHFCQDSVAFPKQENVNPLLDERERTGLARCNWKREILLPSTSGMILIDTMLNDLSSVSIPRQNLLLQQGSLFSVGNNITLGYRHNYSSDPVNSANFTSFPSYHGTGIKGLELSEPQDLVPFQQQYQSVLRAYSSINGDIGMTFLSASDTPLEFPQSREVQSIPYYGENCADSTCANFSSTHYGSEAPTAEVSRFASQGRQTDDLQRKFQDNTIQISPAHLSGIDIVLRDFLREGAPQVRLYIQEGDGLVGAGAIYADAQGTASRPKVQEQRTRSPFISDSMKQSFVNATILPSALKMLSETMVVSKQSCTSRFLEDDLPRSTNGAINRNSLYSLLLLREIVAIDTTGQYTLNVTAVLDPANIMIAFLLKCAAYGYYPISMEQNTTEIGLPESSGYILTTGSLEDISESAGFITSLSITEDLLVDGSLTIGSSVHSSTMTIHSSIDMNIGLRFAGPLDSDTTAYLGSGSSTEDSFVFLPDTFGTLVIGDLPSTLKGLDMLEDGDLLFESSVIMGSDSSIGGQSQNTTITVHSVLKDQCPFRFSKSADSAAQIYLCMKDPSADNTILLPDVSGTFMTSSQLRHLNNVTFLEKVSVHGEALFIDTDVQIGGTSNRDILELNANIMGSNFLVLDGIGIKDGLTLSVSAPDPSSQNEITLPDCTGTVITTGNFPTVLERVHFLDDFWTRGDTQLVGDYFVIGTRHSVDATLILIQADLIGDYPLVFDGLSEENDPGIRTGSTTSLSMQQSGGENIITFPDASGVILTSASLPSTISSMNDYTLHADGIAVYSDQICVGTAEPKSCSGCFIFEDMNINVTSQMKYTDHTFSVTATGGVYYFTGQSSAGNYIGASLLPNSGSWSYLSDKNSKQNITALNSTAAISQLVDKVPISVWYYSDDELKTRHMGPYAQDFQAAFHLGSDSSRIVSSDADGVILGAIQGMYELIDQTVQESEQVQAVIRDLQKQITSQKNILEEQAQKLRKNNRRMQDLLLLLYDDLAEVL